MKRTSLLVAVGWFLLTPLLGEVTIKPLDKNRLSIELDGEKFTEYVYGNTPKPILYPIWGPRGIQMMRHYPMKSDVSGEANDHPHHRSFWFTHGDVNGISFWHEGSDAGTIQHHKFVNLISGGERGVIQTENNWLSPDGKRICRDERTLSFQAGSNESRIVDFTITIHASDGEILFGDTKEGSMGIRTHPNLRLSNDQNRGVITASGRAVNSEGHQDLALWGKRAKWVDYWGDIDGNILGVGIFDHPSNLRHPTWWHARQYGLVAANPFGIHDFERKPDGTGDYKIAEGKSLTFRYRFVFHKGNAEQAGIADLYQAFANE